VSDLSDRMLLLLQELAALDAGELNSTDSQKRREEIGHEIKELARQKKGVRWGIAQSFASAEAVGTLASDIVTEYEAQSEQGINNPRCPNPPLLKHPRRQPVLRFADTDGAVSTRRHGTVRVELSPDGHCLGDMEIHIGSQIRQVRNTALASGPKG